MTDEEKKLVRKRGPYGRGQGTGVLLRLHPPLLTDLDNWIAERPDPKPTRPEAVRQLVERALTKDL